MKGGKGFCQVDAGSRRGCLRSLSTVKARREGLEVSSQGMHQSPPKSTLKIDFCAHAYRQIELVWDEGPVLAFSKTFPGDTGVQG